MGCAGIATRILNLGAINCIHNLTSRPLYTGEGSSCAHWLGDWIVASIPRDLSVLTFLNCNFNLEILLPNILTVSRNRRILSIENKYWTRKDM
jgi:hypothetical protein